MGTASLSLAGCDCRPMGTSPIETRIAPRVFGYCVSKRPRAWTGLISRDASENRAWRTSIRVEARKTLPCSLHFRPDGSRRSAVIRRLVPNRYDSVACAVPILRLPSPRLHTPGLLSGLAGWVASWTMRRRSIAMCV
jgi:hypothetical protein